MISGIGVDIVQIARIEALSEKEAAVSGRFAQRVLTQQEMLEYLELQKSDQERFENYNVSDKRSERFLAKRFAVKEAAAKALGTGFRQGLRYEHIGVEHDQLGKPSLVWLDIAQQRYEEQALVASHLSITDEVDYVVAMVVLEK